MVFNSIDKLQNKPNKKGMSFVKAHSGLQCINLIGNYDFSYKSMTGSSQYKFGVLAKIVKHMKSRHQDGDDHPLSLEEILDETNQLDVGSKVKQASGML